MKKIISIFFVFVFVLSVFPLQSLAATTQLATITDNALPIGKPIMFESEKYPGFFINTYAGKNKDGTKITIWRFDGTTDEWYVLEHLGNGEYYIRAYSSSKGTNRVIDIYWGNHNSKAVRENMPIDIWTPSKSESKFQKFITEIHDDGTVSFRVASNKNLALSVNNKGSNGSQLIIKKYSSDDKAVKFRICNTNGKPIDIKTNDEKIITSFKPNSSGISARISATSIKSTGNVTVDVKLNALAISDTITIKIGNAIKQVKPTINKNKIEQSAKVTFSGAELVHANGITLKSHNVTVICTNNAGSVQKNISSLKVTSDYVKPLKAINGGRTNIVTQDFGSNGYYTTKDHLGVDYSGSSSYVVAITDGVVIDMFTGYGHGYGNTVILKHNIEGKEVFTLYGHMKNGSIKVKLGDTVTAGDILGTMGTTGNSSGNHTHVAVFTMKNYQKGTVPAGYYSKNFSGNTSIKYGSITYYSSEKFIASQGSIVG